MESHTYFIIVKITKIWKNKQIINYKYVLI
jgi:hypothetical protein